MDKIKWVIIGIVILIIIILLVVLSIPKNKENTDKNNNIKEKTNTISEKEKNQINTPPSLSSTPGYSEYFTVNNCISQYLGTVNVNSSRYYGRNDNGEFVLNVSETEVMQMARDLTNGLGSIELYNDKMVFTPIKILRKETTRIDTYIAHGIISNTDLQYIKDVYYAVYLDTVNKTFAVQPLNINDSDLQNVSTETLEKIEKNEYNQFTYQNIDEQYRYKQIFNNMKMLMLIKPDIAYSYLDEEYKNNRFGSYESFEDYLNKNRDHLIGINPYSFKKSDEDNTVIIQDQYSNWYEFKITNTMEYTAKIDNYIVMYEKNIKEYNNYKDKEKIKYNINRWIKMFNNKEYSFAYNYLDETFKQDNYETLEKFEQFMQAKYPDYYNEISIDVKQEGSVYTAEVQLSVKDDEYADKYITIIMKLKEGTDFVLSFDAQ